MAINFPDSPTNGQVFTSGSTSWIYDGVKWGLNTNVAVSNDSMPVGSILWYANTTSAPPGWIAADGSAVSRTTYATLFSTIGTTYGAGDGSTTFNVPNVAATTGKYYIRYTTSLGTVTTTSLSTAPVGTMIDWPVTSSYPTGWLRADGSAVSRTSYADLFALLSTTYGSGDGSTTFNLPNLPAAGSGSPVKIIKASLGGTVEPSTVAHASSHTEGGSDVVTVTGNQISNYQTYRNVVINGSMSVAQRATSKVSITASDYYTADRWKTNVVVLGTWTQSVENDAPAGSGFRKSLKMLCTASAAPLSFSFATIETRLEGQNLQHFAKGTSSAKRFALSFWVKSNVTGTYIVRLLDNQNARHVSAAYTVSQSATWQKVTVVFPADITGVLFNDNNTALECHFYLGAGSNFTTGALATVWAADSNANRAVGQVNVAAATNNYWQVTGVQLEAGDVTTPFEFEPYETTLRKCQRYLWRSDSFSNGWGFSGFIDSTSTAIFVTNFPVTMRATPNFSSSGTFEIRRSGVASTAVSSFTSNLTVDGVRLNATTGTANLTAGQGAILTYSTGTPWMEFSAEL